MRHADWYEKTYPELHKSGLWLRGGELNTLPLSEYEARPFRAMFVRLSTYLDTGYSFTHQLLYQLAARTPGVFPDLAYLPPRPDVALFARDKLPWLLGTQTKRGPEDFDLIGFSNAIVQELVNLPAFLATSGIPLSKAARLARADLPLVILGGANALYSSAIWLDDPLVDGVFVGESDEAIRRILEVCRDGKAEGLSKVEVLEALEEVPGFFQPERPRPVRKAMILDLNRSEALESGPVFYLEEQMGTGHLQISEGCPCFCSFCAESWERKPYRERSAGVLHENALRAKAAMGLDSIDLYSFSFNLHSGLYPLLWELLGTFRNIGLKSQRFDFLAEDPGMVEFQHVVEKANLTCGIEGISPRLRRYLHKNLETGQLLRALGALFRSKARELKLFLVATGLEEEADEEAFEELLGELAKLHRGTGTRVVFSMTPLVRFPWTPLEFEDAPAPARYAGLLRRTAASVRAAGFEFRESAGLPEYWLSQVLVRAADPRVSRALLQAVEATGFLYYRDVPGAFADKFAALLVKQGVDPEGLLRGSTLEESREKPWARVETGVEREFLWEEVQRARAFVEQDYCLGRPWVQAKCGQCGACPTPLHVLALVKATQPRSYSLAQFKERAAQARRTDAAVELLVVAGPAARGVPRRNLGVALARALMLTDGALTPFYRGYTGAYWADGERDVWVTGADRVTLVFSGDGRARIEALVGQPQALARLNGVLGEWGEVRGLAPAGWRPGRLHIASPYALRADDYLKPRGLKHTLRKDAQGQSLYELTPQSRKKGIVLSLSGSRDADGLTTGVLEPGPKLIPREFAQEAFALPHARDWVRTRLHSTVL